MLRQISSAIYYFHNSSTTVSTLSLFNARFESSHNKSVHCLLAIRVMSGGSLPPLSPISYILFPVFLGVLLVVWLLLCFLHSFSPLGLSIQESLCMLSSFSSLPGRLCCTVGNHNHLRSTYKKGITAP